MAAQGVADMGAGGLVERGERFVEQEEPGAGGQRPGQRDALGLAAGELGGFAVREMADAEPVEPVLGAAAGLGARDAMGAQPVGGVAQGAQMREEGAVLGDPGDTAAVRGERGDVGVAEAECRRGRVG